MIRYSLKCQDDHGFESWFRSAEAYDTLRKAGGLACPVCGDTRIDKAGKAGGLACPVCGDTRIDKALMAPAVRTAEDRPLAAPASEMERALAELRRQVEENSEYVGLNFAAEARAIHEGDAPARSIHGEARIDEARRLLEDGVPVAPLPFVPPRKAN